MNENQQLIQRIIDIDKEARQMMNEAAERRTGSARAVQMKKQEVFNEHRDVYVFTPKGNYLLRSFAIVHTTPYEPVVELNFPEKADMTAYIEDKMARSEATPDPAAPAAGEIDQIFSFSTCDEYSSGAHYMLFCYVVEFAAFDGSSGGDAVLVDPNTESVVDDAVNEQ